MCAAFMFEKFTWVFLALLFVNVLQRRHGRLAEKKRFATLYLAIAVFLLQLWSGFIHMQGFSDIWLIPGTLVVFGIVIYFRQYTFPFRFLCKASGKRLDMKTFLYRDSNILDEYEETEYKKHNKT